MAALIRRASKGSICANDSACGVFRGLGAACLATLHLCALASEHDVLAGPLLQLGQLERQCSALAAELRELKLRHEEELANQAAQHAAHVAHVS